MKVVGPDPAEVTHQHILDFLRIRKSHFVDCLGWDLTHTANAEWDEYDIPHALFVVAYDGSHCVGGARLQRTDLETPCRGGSPATFMIGDFLSGRIATALTHQDMIEAPRANADTWEMTRFVGSSPIVTAAILQHVNRFLISVGAKSVLTISPVLMPRVLKRLGYSATKLSLPVEFDGKKYVVLETLVNYEMTERLTAREQEYT